MSPQEACNFINDRIRLGWPFEDWGARVHARQTEYAGELEVTVGLPLAPRRDSGAKNTGGPVLGMVIGEQSMQYGADALVRRIRALLVDLVVHELDESILVDGVRVFDPHAKEARNAGEAGIGARPGRGQLGARHDG